jgi:hypothetical protein
MLSFDERLGEWSCCKPGHRCLNARRVLFVLRLPRCSNDRVEPLMIVWLADIQGHGDGADGITQGAGVGCGAQGHGYGSDERCKRFSTTHQQLAEPTGHEVQDDVVDGPARGVSDRPHLLEVEFGEANASPWLHRTVDRCARRRRSAKRTSNLRTAGTHRVPCPARVPEGGNPAPAGAHRRGDVVDEQPPRPWCRRRVIGIDRWIGTSRVNVE